MGSVLGDTMARRRRNRSVRDTFDIATPQVHERPEVLRESLRAAEEVHDLYRSHAEFFEERQTVNPRHFINQEDERRFYPKPAWQTHWRVTVPAERERTWRETFRHIPTRSFYVGHREVYRFKDPTGILTCVRRKARRQVWFAKKLHKKGGGGGRRRFTARSFIHC